MQTIIATEKRWAIQWRQENSLDGKRSYLLGVGDGYKTFRTRSQAREFIEERFGYIRNRTDLKAEPHGWKMPRAIKVTIDYCVD